MSFRVKLLLAMSLIVAGVSLAVLMVTQRRVQENYERMFRNQFERQIGYFTAFQDQRLGAVKEQCLKLSQSVRLLAILNEQETDTERLYQIATDELRGVLEEATGDTRSSGRGNERRLRAGLLCFLGSDGKLIPPAETTRNRMMIAAMRRRIESKQSLVREALASAEIQQVGYLAVEAPSFDPGAMRPGFRRPNATPRAAETNQMETVLQEVIVTRILDPENNRALGWLVLGFQMPDLVPMPKNAGTNLFSSTQSLIKAGILLEGKLYASTNLISETLGAAIADEVSLRTTNSTVAQADFKCVVDGDHYRVFYELMNERSAFPATHQVCIYPMAEALKEQRALRWKILGSATAALVIGLALCLFLSHGLSAPIRELVGGAGEIQRGNFQVRLPVRSHDELGRLTGAFNDMAEGLAQKEKYRTVLNMVADEKIAHQLMQGELTLGGELREITVLFCDIRGFTALTQNMPPDEVIEMLNEHMTALTRVVKEHHGVLDKFVGDLLMAIFGAPVTHGDDALNAGRCALRLQQVREELNRTSRHNIEIGIGVATGTVVAGCMGSEDRLNYTVLGERVNLASRLCSQAKAGEVLVDENSRQKFAGVLSGEPLGEIQLKGFSQAVQVFRLCRKQAQQSK